MQAPSYILLIFNEDWLRWFIGTFRELDFFPAYPHTADHAQLTTATSTVLFYFNNLNVSDCA
jgi:hypothetical protein